MPIVSEEAARQIQEQIKTEQHGGSIQGMWNRALSSHDDVKDPLKLAKELIKKQDSRAALSMIGVIGRALDCIEAVGESFAVDAKPVAGLEGALKTARAAISKLERPVLSMPVPKR